MLNCGVKQLRAINADKRESTQWTAVIQSIPGLHSRKTINKDHTPKINSILSSATVQEH